MATPANFDSAVNESFSLTRRWDPTSILKALCDSLVDLVLEESWQESNTEMEGFITMLSFFSTQHTILATQLSSMLGVLTPISKQFDGLLKEHTTTSEKMETSSGTTLTNQILTDLNQLPDVIGQISYLHRTKLLFMTQSKHWIQELLYAVSPASRNTPIGRTVSLPNRTIARAPGLTEISPSGLNSRNGTRRMSENEILSEAAGENPAPPLTSSQGEPSQRHPPA